MRSKKKIERENEKKKKHDNYKRGKEEAGHGKVAK